jgi:hypothetical protein
VWQSGGSWPSSRSLVPVISAQGGPAEALFAVSEEAGAEMPSWIICSGTHQVVE